MMQTVFFQTQIFNQLASQFSKKIVNKINNNPNIKIDFITDNKNNLTTIPMGARLPLFKNNKILTGYCSNF